MNTDRLIFKNTDLKAAAQKLIYSEQNHVIPEAYARFRIVNPEYSPQEVEVKPYPMSERDHLFALLWDIDGGHRLSSTILPSEAAFTFSRDFEPGMRTQMHTHEYMELFYIIDGEYRQRILGNEYTFHKGEVCLIDRTCQHQEIIDGAPATILFLGITNAMFNDIMRRHVTTEHISSFLNTAFQERKRPQQYLHFVPLSGGDEALSQVLTSLLSELYCHDEAAHYICQGLLMRLLGILSTQYDFSLAKNQKTQMNYQLFEKLTRYMEEHMAAISITGLSEEFHFQEDYFNRLLKLHTGLTYTEYLQSLRLHRAESLLLATSYSIDQIAEEVGYHNKGYFYKIFSEKYGMTPAQLRKGGCR